MPRTIEELDKAEREFIKDVEKRFLARTTLGEMMTEEDHKAHHELIVEYMVAIRLVEEKKVKADSAYIELNNLYLSIQRGDVKLTRKEYNQLDSLLGQVYTHGDMMHDWWWKEFQRLPGWLNV